MTNETYVTRALPSDPLCRTGAEFAREVVERRTWRIDAVHRTARRVAALLGASASLCRHARRGSDRRRRPRVLTSPCTALPSEPLCRTGAEFAREVVDRRAWRIDAVHRTAQRVAALLGASASLCGHARRVSDRRRRPRALTSPRLSRLIRSVGQERNSPARSLTAARGASTPSTAPRNKSPPSSAHPQACADTLDADRTAAAALEVVTPYEGSRHINYINCVHGG